MLEYCAKFELHRRSRLKMLTKQVERCVCFLTPTGGLLLITVSLITDYFSRRYFLCLPNEYPLLVRYPLTGFNFCLASSNRAV